MNCAWKELMGVLSPWIRSEVEESYGHTLQELRLRTGAPPEVTVPTGRSTLPGTVGPEDLRFCVNAVSRYSPWTAATSEKGYLTAPGGHRIGLCGRSAPGQGRVRLQELTSVCIRVARDFPGIAAGAAKLSGPVLILGPPGWGKTTLLRDLCRQISRKAAVCVVDERGELFPEGLPGGESLDVLSGCSKTGGIDTVLRTMGPECIAVDEITAPEDCEALLRAANCGVRLLATAHASCVEDYRTRPVYQKLVKQRVFPTVLLLRRDKTYSVERMTQ